MRWAAWWIAIPIGLVAIGVVTFQGWRWWVLPDDAPIVGVSLDTAWHSRIGITTTTYQTALARVGGRMRSIRPDGASPEDVLDGIDALLLAGGGDVDPDLSGANPAHSSLIDRRRDDFELELIRGALVRKMPILGICRGIQILNVAHGGSLRSLHDQPTLNEVHGFALDHVLSHPVIVEERSRLARFVGAGEKSVNSFHSQSVDRPGDGLEVVAVSTGGVIEGVERSDRPFVIAIQWHPEILSLADSDELAVLRALIEEARRYRDTD